MPAARGNQRRDVAPRALSSSGGSVPLRLVLALWYLHPLFLLRTVQDGFANEYLAMTILEGREVSLTLCGNFPFCNPPIEVSEKVLGAIRIAFRMPTRVMRVGFGLYV